MAFDFTIKKDDSTLQKQNLEIKQAVADDKRGFWTRGKDAAVGFLGSIGSAVEQGVDYVESEFFTNTDSKRGIKDFDGRQKYNNLLENPDMDSSDKQVIYDQMVKEDIIDWNKYNEYNKSKQDDYNKNTTELKKLIGQNVNVFRNRLEDSITENVKNIESRYELDVLSKGVDKLTNQYEMLYTNLMETYNETHDDKLLEEWDNMQDMYEQKIVDFTKGFANRINEGDSFRKAYNDTVNADEKGANKIVALQQQIERSMYRSAIKDNFGAAIDDLQHFNPIKGLGNFLAGTMNVISAGFGLAGQGIEETKQFTTNRYDMIEELANLNVYKDGTGMMKKGFGTLGSWATSVFDGLPSLAPAVASVMFGNKVSTASKAKNAISAIFNMKKLAGGAKLVQAGRRSTFAMENVNDAFLLDAAIQASMGRPLTTEDFATNWMFNIPINSAVARLSSKLKIADYALTNAKIQEDYISKSLLNRIKNGKDINELGEAYFMAKSVGDKNEVNLTKLYESNPTLWNKIKKVQTQAIDYRDTAQLYNVGLKQELSQDQIKTIQASERQARDIGLDIESAEEHAKTLTDYLNSPYQKANFGLDSKLANTFIKKLIKNKDVTTEKVLGIVKGLDESEGAKDIVIGIIGGDKAIYERGLEQIAKEEMKTPEVIEKVYNRIVDSLNKEIPDMFEPGDTIMGYRFISDDTFQNIHIDTDIITKDELSNLLYKKGIGERKLEVLNVENNLPKLKDKINQSVSDGGKGNSLVNVTDEFVYNNSIGRITIDKRSADKSEAKKLLYNAYSNVGLKISDKEGVVVEATVDNLNKFEQTFASLKNKKSYVNMTTDEYNMYKFINIAGQEELFNGYKLLSPDLKYQEFTTWFEDLYKKEGDNYVLSLKQYNPDIASKEIEQAIKANKTVEEVEAIANRLITTDMIVDTVGKDTTDVLDIVRNMFKHKYSNKGFGGFTNSKFRDTTKQTMSSNIIEPFVNSLTSWIVTAGKGGTNKKEVAVAFGKIFAELVTDTKSLKFLKDIGNEGLYGHVVSRILSKSDEANTVLCNILLDSTAGKKYTNKNVHKFLYKVEELRTSIKRGKKDLGLTNAMQESISIDRTVTNNSIQKATDSVDILKFDKLEPKKIKDIDSSVKDISFSDMKATTDSVVLNTMKHLGVASKKTYEMLSETIIKGLNKIKDEGLEYSFKSKGGKVTLYTNGTPISLNDIITIKLLGSLDDAENYIKQDIYKSEATAIYSRIEGRVDSVINTWKEGLKDSTTTQKKEFSEILSKLLIGDKNIDEYIKAVDVSIAGNKSALLEELWHLYSQAKGANKYKSLAMIDNDTLEIANELVNLRALDNITKRLGLKGNNKVTEIINKLTDTESIIARRNVMFSINKDFTKSEFIKTLTADISEGDIGIAKNKRKVKRLIVGDSLVKGEAWNDTWITRQIKKVMNNENDSYLKNSTKIMADLKSKFKNSVPIEPLLESTAYNFQGLGLKTYDAISDIAGVTEGMIDPKKLLVGEDVMNAYKKHLTKEQIPLSTYLLNRNAANILQSKDAYNEATINIINSKLDFFIQSKVFTDLAREKNKEPLTYLINHLIDSGLFKKGVTAENVLKEMPATELERMNKSIANYFKKNEIGDTIYKTNKKGKTYIKGNNGHEEDTLEGLASEIFNALGENKFNHLEIDTTSAFSRAMAKGGEIAEDDNVTTAILASKIIGEELFTPLNNLYEVMKNKHALHFDPDFAVIETKAFPIDSNLPIMAESLMKDTSTAELALKSREEVLDSIPAGHTKEVIEKYFEGEIKLPLYDYTTIKGIDAAKKDIDELVVTIGKDSKSLLKEYDGLGLIATAMEHFKNNKDIKLLLNGKDYLIGKTQFYKSIPGQDALKKLGIDSTLSNREIDYELTKHLYSKLLIKDNLSNKAGVNKNVQELFNRLQKEFSLNNINDDVLDTLNKATIRTLDSKGKEIILHDTQIQSYRPVFELKNEKYEAGLTGGPVKREQIKKTVIGLNGKPETIVVSKGKPDLVDFSNKEFTDEVLGYYTSNYWVNNVDGVEEARRVVPKFSQGETDDFLKVVEDKNALTYEVKLINEKGNTIEGVIERDVMSKVNEWKFTEKKLPKEISYEELLKAQGKKIVNPVKINKAASETTEEIMHGVGYDPLPAEKTMKEIGVTKPKKWYDIATDFFSLKDYNVVREDELMTRIVGKRLSFMDDNGDMFAQLFKDYKAVEDKYIDAGLKAEFKGYMDEIKNQAKAAIGKDEPLVIMNIGTGIPKDVLEAAENINYLFKNGGIRSRYLFGGFSTKEGLSDISLQMVANHRGIAKSELGIAYDSELRDALSKHMTQYTSEKNAIRLTKNIIGDPLGTGIGWRIISELKTAYRVLKYSPLAPDAGVLMLLNSIVMGNGKLKAMNMGLNGLQNSDEIITLLKPRTKDGKGVFASMSREQDITLFQNADVGKLGVVRFIDFVVNKLPIGDKGRHVVETVFKGGSHSLFDLAVQPAAKKSSLAMALVKNGVTTENIKDFVKKWDLLPEKVKNKILMDAETNYSRFFTNASTTLMSRHKHSHIWFFNTLQGYVIDRTDEVISSAIKFARDLPNIHSRDAFTKYIKTENQEFGGLINNILLTAKMSYYVEVMARNNEDNEGSYLRYMVNMSDHLSSLPATWFARLLSAPFIGAEEYIKYNAITGNEGSFVEGMSVATLKTVSEALRMFFREAKTLNFFSDAAIAYGRTGNMDFAADVAGVNRSKITSGLGRFMQVPGMERYGQMVKTDDTDFLSQVLLAHHEINKPAREAWDLSNIANVEKMINDPGYSVINSIGYLPVIGQMIRTSTNKGGFVFSEAKYNRMMKMLETDVDMKRIYDGEMPSLHMFDDKTNHNLYSELTMFDYDRKSIKANGISNLYTSEYGLNIKKEEVFVKNIIDELGMNYQEFGRMLISKGMDKAGAMKLLAASEAHTPGSSRVLLSHYAKQLTYQLQARVSGTKYGSAMLSKEQKTEIENTVTERLYPYLFVTDKASWYKVIRDVIHTKEPEVFDKIASDNGLKGYMNTLGFLDMMMMSYAKDGDVNARAINNSFSTIGKYMGDENSRIGVINNVLDTIDTLGTTPEVKLMMRQGVLAGNMDFYDRIKKDEVMGAVYKDDIDKFDNKVWGTIEQINTVGTSLAKSKLTPYEKKQYESVYGKKFEKSKYADGNSKVQSDFQKKFNNVYKPTENVRPTYRKEILPMHLSPLSVSGKHFTFYLKIYEKALKAMSEKLVKSSMKRYPAQFTENLSFKTLTGGKGRIKADELSFRRGRKKFVSTQALPGLPGG